MPYLQWSSRSGTSSVKSSGHVGSQPRDTLLGFCSDSPQVRGKLTDTKSLTYTHSFIYSFNKYYQEAALVWGPEVEATG